MGLYGDLKKGWKLYKEDLERRNPKGKRCSGCGYKNDEEDNYCGRCGHKLRDIPKTDKAYREFCPICRDRITKDMDYCGKYGHKIERNSKKSRICPICGKLVVEEKYCLNCGHEFNYLTVSSLVFYDKVCPNCNMKYGDRSYYCNDCGTKLRKRTLL